MRRTSAEKTSCSCRSDAARLYSLHPQHDPWRAAPLAWRTRSHDNGLLGLQTGRSPVQARRSAARALAASERLSASVRFRAVTGRPSRPLPRLGCAICGLVAHAPQAAMRLLADLWLFVIPARRRSLCPTSLTRNGGSSYSEEKGHADTAAPGSTSRQH